MAGVRTGGRTATAVDHSADAAVDQLEERQKQLRVDGRAALGVTPEADRHLRSLRDVVSEAEAGWYLLVALTVLAALDEASASILGAIGPDVSKGLGVSPAAFSAITAQRHTFVGLIALLFAYMFYHRHRRSFIAKQLGAAYGASFIFGSLVTWSPAFVPVAGGAGGGGAAIYAAHRPMIVDAYPPAGRVRALSFHRGGAVLGGILAPGLVAALSGAAGLTWRGVLLVTGLAFLVCGVIALRLRDPGYGRFDTDRLSKMVEEAEDSTNTGRTGDPTELRFGEALRQAWLIPSVRRLLIVWALFGATTAPLVSYQMFFLQERFHLTLGYRSAFYAASWCFAIPALWLFGRRGEAAFRERPAALVQLTAKVMIALVGGLVVAVVPVLGVSLVGFGIVFAASAVAVPALTVSLLSVVRPRSRPIAGALSGLFFAFVGAEGGALLGGGIDTRYSTSAAIVALSFPALLAAWLLRCEAARIDEGLDRVIDEVVEDEEIRFMSVTGRHVPMLACHGIDFSYGQLQVLFGVDFTVDDGEMVALLGVNGAGKSTLLKVVSGIGLPSAGSVRLSGSNITYLDAARRVRLGITQVPGGRAVFGPMTVMENLRALGFTLGRDGRRLDTAIDRCFDAFPRLAERRNQLASTLSGGEQQMLGLSKALILEPRLLLIDELALGLAPIIVSRLLDMVRQINATGAAVVLVEQSVSIALNLVHHAYFMEKGEIRFDGPATDLLARHDLLRAVFLEGVGDGGRPR